MHKEDRPGPRVVLPTDLAAALREREEMVEAGKAPAETDEYDEAVNRVIKAATAIYVASPAARSVEGQTECWMVSVKAACELWFDRPNRAVARAQREVQSLSRQLSRLVESIPDGTAMLNERLRERQRAQSQAEVGG